jgi:hypothetical protein
MLYKIFKIAKKVMLYLAIVFFFIWLISLLAPRSKNIEYGVTFSQPYAESLNLNWKETYLSIIADLKPKYVRLSAYWNKIESERGVFEFNDLDFQVAEAEKAGVKIILGVGRRLPRWPECHAPSWINNLSREELNNAQLSYVAAVVERYANNQAILQWQVENEAFVSTFGECPPLDVELFDKEIALVKSIDPSRSIVITDSGELNFWFKASSRGDIFGTTLYRYVYSDLINNYWTNYFPALFYRFKAGMIRILHPDKPIVIMELQAEPWTQAGVLKTSVEEQMLTMSMSNLNKITQIAKDTGFSPQILWGAEWWYYMKVQKNQPEFWDKAKELMKN